MPLHCGTNFVAAASKNSLKILQQQTEPCGVIAPLDILYIAITLPSKDTNYFFCFLSSTEWWKITWKLWSVSLWSKWFKATPSSFGHHDLILLILREIFVVKCYLLMLQGLKLFQALCSLDCGSFMPFTCCRHGGLHMHGVRKPCWWISQQLQQRLKSCCSELLLI